MLLAALPAGQPRFPAQLCAAQPLEPAPLLLLGWLPQALVVVAVAVPRGQQGEAAVASVALVPEQEEAWAVGWPAALQP